MTDKFQSQCIIVYYPCGAGGKFIVNSLGLSQYCVPQHPQLAVWDMQQTMFNNTYYQTKLDQILKTIPPIHDLNNWQNYELGVDKAWGMIDEQTMSITPALIDIVNSDRHFCLIVHTPEELKQVIIRYPNLNVIKLTNYSQWLVRSNFKLLDLKNDIDNKVDYWRFIDQEELKNPQIPYILVDIDSTINNHTAMLNQIQNLYNRLKFNDFNSSFWNQYYQKYISIHPK